MAILGSIGGGVAKAALGLGVGSAIYGAATREDTPKDPYGYGTNVQGPQGPSSEEEIYAQIQSSPFLKALVESGIPPEQVVQMNQQDIQSIYSQASEAAKAGDEQGKQLQIVLDKYYDQWNQSG